MCSTNFMTILLFNSFCVQMKKWPDGGQEVTKQFRISSLRNINIYGKCIAICSRVVDGRTDQPISNVLRPVAGVTLLKSPLIVYNAKVLDVNTVLYRQNTVCSFNQRLSTPSMKKSNNW